LKIVVKSTNMSAISILNDVIGPIMRGPSSSHTAGAFFIGRAARSVLGEPLVSARVVFDPNGSFARVYQGQKSDVGFAAGLLGKSITDEEFSSSLAEAKAKGLQITFECEPIKISDHPNAVTINATSIGRRRLSLTAASIGGGQIRIDQVDGTPVAHDGRRLRLLITAAGKLKTADLARQLALKLALDDVQVHTNSKDSTGQSVLCEGCQASLEKLADRVALEADAEASLLPATDLVVSGASKTSLGSVREIMAAAQSCGDTLAGLGRRYEAQLLSMHESAVGELMSRRWGVMKAAIDRSLRGPSLSMRFLSPSAKSLMDAASSGKLFSGGMLPRASAAALAVMETSTLGGVVCAAPTAGSAGIIPGILFALQEEKKLTDDRLINALFSMGVIGAMVAIRATFAAEVCGCAAETGAAAAMAAAGLVELGGGNIEQAMDAASLCLMNTMGLVCDPVQGHVEIPCHARNISGVAQGLAFADAVLGGFKAILPLDEVIDCMLIAGKQIPYALRCTSLGGLASTPTSKLL